MSVTNSDLNKLKTKFSVKNFITELPNMLNNALTVICNCITDFYVPDENKIKCNKAEIGTIEATTITVQNLSIKGANSQYNYGDIPNILDDLQRKMNQIYPNRLN